MNARDPWRSAQDEFRAVRKALAVLEHALPAFRDRVVSLGEPMHRFMALDAQIASTGLAELAQTLSMHVMRLSECKQVISLDVAVTMDSIRRYRQYIQEVDGGGVSGELQGLVDSAVRGMADVERMVAQAEHLLEHEVQRIVELALRFDLPDSVLQRAQQLIDRAKQ